MRSDLHCASIPQRAHCDLATVPCKHFLGVRDLASDICILHHSGAGDVTVEMAEMLTARMTEENGILDGPA